MLQSNQRLIYNYYKSGINVRTAEVNNVKCHCLKTRPPFTNAHTIGDHYN